MNPTNESVQPAHLQFLTGWQTVQQGDITQGGKLVIDYDPQRLPNLRKEWNGVVIWKIEVFVRFHPGDQLFRKPVMKIHDVDVVRGINRGYWPEPVELDVPKEATQVELWFRSWLDVSGYQEAWDSRNGQNYWFDVVQVSAP